MEELCIERRIREKNLNQIQESVRQENNNKHDREKIKHNINKRKY